MDVHLLVYDLSRGLARQMSAGLLGFQLDAVYHTSIQLNGREYVYDGNVVAIRPGSSHLGQPMQKLHLGRTELPMEVIEEYLDSLREIFTVEAYDLWRHNCNNFSNDFATFLLGKGIPGHITNMPQAVLDSPFGQMLMPTLTQQINANKGRGGILGIEQQTPGSSVKPQSQLHHPLGKVHAVSSLGQLDELLVKFQKSCAVVFFTSATCPPCKTLYPLYDELAGEIGEKGVLIKVDTSHAVDIGSRYSISATPTFITFLKGKQENRWSGADPSALRGNVQLLVQMAWPPHPHQALNLPTFSNPNAEYVTFSKIPPLPKLLAKMGPTAAHPAIQSIKTFIETRSSEGPAETTVPDLAAFTALVRSSLTALPTDLLFTIVDLLRCALVDPRVSGYLAEEQPAHHTMTAILTHVTTTLPPQTCPYALRLVTLQLACNLFTSPLYPPQILSHPPLRSLLTQLISSSFLDDAHTNTRVAAAALLFNVALANSRKRREGPGDALPEDEQVELAASVLEAIAQEEASAEALEGMLLALGWLAYCMPAEGELAGLLRVMDAGGVVLKKAGTGVAGKGGLVKEVGGVLLGEGILEQRFRDVVADINETLIGISLHPRLMPNSAGHLDVVAQRSVRSCASTPSLRSRDGTVPPHARADPGGNVRVVVRVRAFLPREIQRDAECLIHMDPVSQQTTLLVPNDSDPANARARARKVLEEKAFTFDNSFWSHDPEDEHYATQEDVYDSLGEEFLDHNFEGYHTCIFAYGQTGSGKSYTMMGTPDHPGLIPRTCEDLFERIAAAQDETPNISYNVRVSYFEVYNEHVRDLLVPIIPHQPPYYLKIRESPTEGPYVKDLTEVPVRSLHEIIRYMRVGDNNRTTASTKMNDTSSRSHAVFTIMLKQIHHDLDTDETTERSSRIRLVDLAGSERAKSTEATGQRLREGSNINKSLTTLGRVIAALADPKQQRPRPGGASSTTRKDTSTVVPYRDSILTWLLKDSLGGNSKTAMIACIAPSDYEETLSTLRYADQAKRIRTRAVVNQVDSLSAAERDAQIAAMEAEIRALQLVVGDSRRREKDAREAEEKLEEYQARVRGLQLAMEERTLVAEGKIRSLQTENEALRLHLKLALESLRNPIPAFSTVAAAAGKEGVDGGRERGVDDEADDDKENIPTGEKGDDDDDGYASGSLSSEEEEEAGYERNADDMHEHMSGLLKDLNMFRRKIGDDKTRFVDELSRRRPLGERATNII
ncbi:P-loop containing nucleoside triphosphate hydrolase protein [Parachaetomium inaequale]|uniref:P-loop containing nucleoside triphosphate hydrolase protein n=1 Tax=Parachaetomium inaequale TaxID=2588326 RepID=A0AAN6PEH5_9PEZI|nr:P-loop containing nucleoside triphosphate hydrolase protein [Parachaetomium inaequale]